MVKVNIGEGEADSRSVLRGNFSQSHMFEEDIHLFPIQLWSRDGSIITQETSYEVGFPVTQNVWLVEKKNRGFQNQKNKNDGTPDFHGFKNNWYMPDCVN